MLFSMNLAMLKMLSLFSHFGGRTLYIVTNNNVFCPTLRLSSLFAAEKNREGATSATSAASPKVYSRHDF
jgi:hypothetical protein